MLSPTPPLPENPPPEETEAEIALSIPPALFAEEELLFCSTRAQALSDGLLVDVSEAARQVGIAYPSAVTRALWADIRAGSLGASETQTASRLAEILQVVRTVLETSAGAACRAVFPVTLPTVGQEIADYPIRLVCEPEEDGRLAITLLCPEE